MVMAMRTVKSCRYGSNQEEQYGSSEEDQMFSIAWPFMLLIMVFRGHGLRMVVRIPFDNGESPVKLLHENKPDQLVGKSEL
jgi:hypothetical protein